MVQVVRAPVPMPTVAVVQAVKHGVVQIILRTEPGTHFMPGRTYSVASAALATGTRTVAQVSVEPVVVVGAADHIVVTVVVWLMEVVVLMTGVVTVSFYVCPAAVVQNRTVRQYVVMVVISIAVIAAVATVVVAVVAVTVVVVAVAVVVSAVVAHSTPCVANVTRGCIAAAAGSVG